jgi:hypothetical protein
MFHDMTPMAGRVSNAQKDGFVLGSGFGKRFITPGMPINRIIRMLEQVWGIFVDQVVRHGVPLG